MHCPGHFIGKVITATGVTPDIVLVDFFIVYFRYRQFSRFELMGTIKPLYDTKRGVKEGQSPLFKNHLPLPLEGKGIKGIG